jgi:hypothetical protein
MRNQTTETSTANNSSVVDSKKSEVLANTSETAENKKEWIIDCPTKQVIDICRKYLILVDDLQQECNESEQESLLSSYNFFENFSKKYSKNDVVSIEDRNSIRMTMKHVLRQASMVNYDYSEVLGGSNNEF